MKIKKIEINKFRGIPNLILDLNNRSLLLKGDNGTGKSSIVDAIEFFFTGKISHLEGVQGLSLHKHAPHVNYSSQDVKIDVTFDRDVILSRSLYLKPSPPSDMKSFFDFAEQGNFILRRAQLLEFIISQPAERFKAIGNLIGIDKLDKIELSIKRYFEQCQADEAEQTNKIQYTYRNISLLLESDIRDKKDILPKLNEIVLSLGLPMKDCLEDYKDISETILKEVKKEGRREEDRKLYDIIENSKNARINKSIIDDLSTINELIRSIIKEDRRKELAYIDLLKTGKDIINNYKLTRCPLCEQEINNLSIIEQIDKRLKLLKQLSDEASKIRQIINSIKNKLSLKKDILNKIKQNILLFKQGFEEETDELVRLINIISEIIIELTKVEELNRTIKLDLNDFIKNVDITLKKIVKKIEIKIENTQLSERDKQLIKLSSKIDKLLEYSTNLQRLEQDLAIKERYKKISEKIFNYFSSVKKEKLENIFINIQEDIQSYFSILHPKDPHKNFEMSVMQGRRASAKVYQESFGKKEDPRAFSSEGHLDSLGLCIFLAFINKFNSDFPLVILDDIVTTIDARHRENICKLLIEKFNDKQLFITTHDGIWYEQLRSHQRAYSVENLFYNYQIIDWDVNCGPKIRPYKTNWESIMKNLENGEKKEAGNNARQYLEWILEEICNNFKAKVKFISSGRYMIVDFWEPAKTRLLKKIKDYELKQKIENAFKELSCHSIMGNLLSHNNIDSENVTFDEVDRFCKAVHQLRNAILCPKCNKDIIYIESEKLVICKNKNCRKTFS